MDDTIGELGSVDEAGAEGREQLDELRQLVVGVEAARVREDPELGTAERLRLAADRGCRLAECRPERGDAEDGDDARRESLHRLPKPVRTRAKLVRRELGRGRGRPVDEVRDPDSQLEELAGLV